MIARPDGGTRQRPCVRHARRCERPGILVSTQGGRAVDAFTHPSAWLALLLDKETVRNYARVVESTSFKPRPANPSAKTRRNHVITRGRASTLDRMKEANTP